MMGAKVNRGNFETLYEVLWNYCVVKRIVAKEREEKELDGEKKEMMSEAGVVSKVNFWAELITSLILVFERKAKAKKAGKRRNQQRACMIQNWQDEESRKFLVKEIYNKAKEDASLDGSEEKAELIRWAVDQVDSVYETAVDDMYQTVCGGPEKVSKLLQKIVTATHVKNLGNINGGLATKVRHVRNKINFLIAIVENYGHTEEAVARQQLRMDMQLRRSNSSSDSTSSQARSIRGKFGRHAAKPTARTTVVL
jgi:hypothetical protein